MFYIKIKKENKGYIVEFWFNTDLRTEKFYNESNFGSLEMMNYIDKWITG